MAEESKPDALVTSYTVPDTFPAQTSESPSESAAIGRKVDKGVYAPKNENYEKDEFYPVTKEHHGICVIFYYTEYPADVRRDTTLPDISRDIDSLRRVWTDRGYTVQTHKNLSEEGLKQKIKTVLDDSKEKLSKGDASFVCILLPYGAGGKLYANDKTIQLDVMAAALTGNACKELVYIPKMFFIDAYSEPSGKVDGHMKDGPGEEASDVKYSRIPEVADFFFAFSKPPGYYNQGHEDRCWFVRELCKILAEDRDEVELSTLMEMVTEKAAEDYPNGPVPTSMSMLTKMVKFRSSISGTSGPSAR